MSDATHCSRAEAEPVPHLSALPLDGDRLAAGRLGAVAGDGAARDHALTRNGAPAVDTFTHHLADGRAVTIRQAGAVFDSRPGGGARAVPVLALHGTPGSRLKFHSTEATAGELGLTLFCVDRWGYGGTALNPRPSLRAFAADMAEVLDHLAIDRVSVVGVSGGGPFAVALAAVMPDRVASLALVAPVGDVARAPSGEGFRSFHRFCFSVLPRIPGATTAVFSLYRALLKAAPLTAAGLISARAGAGDRRIVLMPDVRARLAETFATGLDRGVAGPACDLALFARPWDVDVGRIRAATRVWLGSEDRNVPIGPVEALASAVPDAQLVRLASQGHYWIALNYREVLGWIAAAHATG